MTDNVNILNGLLNKYRFTAEIPPGVKDEIHKNKQHSLGKTLKRLNEYSAFYAFVISIYFTVRRSGIKITITGSKLILTGAALFISGSATYFAYNTIIQIEKENPIIQELERARPFTPGNIRTIEDRSISASSQPVVLSIESIEVSGPGDSNYTSISKRIYESLLKYKKPDTIILSSVGDSDIKALNKLVGRLHPLGEKYVLTIKIVDSGKGIIKFSETISFNKDEDIGPKIETLVKAISVQENLW